MAKAKIWRGLAMTSGLLLTLSILSASVMEMYRIPLDDLVHTQSQKTVTEESENEEDAWNYEQKFHSVEEAYQGYKDFALKLADESFVLLKNNNSALPLSANPKVTMFGLRSYAPVYGNSGGSIADKTTIENGNTITDALQSKGFQLNPSMLNTYKTYCDGLTWGGVGFGAVPPEYLEITSTSDIPELSKTELSAINSSYNSQYSEYNDAAIVVLGRPGGESKNYYLGEEGLAEGVSTTTGNIMSLSTEEKEIIAEAKANFDKVIVLINSVTTMEFKELEDDPDIDAIMWIGYPGAYGFYSLADTLTGKINPSAHLGDIYVTNNQANPAMQSFGNIPWANAADFSSDENVNSYLIEAEGIYSGYRYYETRYYETVLGNTGAKTAKAGTYTNANGTIGTTDGTWNYENEVVYPFGYGLSYTEFDYSFVNVEIMGDKKTANVSVRVENTGEVAGKAPVQLYVQTPYSEYDKQYDVEKSAIQLVDFEKSTTLEPHTSQVINMQVDLSNFASYDYTNAKTFIVDPGDYFFALGTDSHDALNNVLAAQNKTTADGMDYNGDSSKTYKWNWSGDVDSDTFSVVDNGTETVNITNKLSDGDYSVDLNSFIKDKVTYLSREDFNATFPEKYEGLSSAEDTTGRLTQLLKNDFIELKEEDTSEFVWGQESDLTINDLKGASFDDERWEELVDKMTIDEFLDFAGNAFHNIQKIDSVGYVGNNADDGPGGSDSHSFGEGQYRGEAFADKDTSQYASYGTRVTVSQQNIAYTWNKELAYENGEIILGETSLMLKLPIMIGPAGNLHRHGYNGRGGEYYSEDPVLSGYIGSAIVQGAQSKGCLVNIKHAAFNDQEINRSGVAVFMNEQKARELELRNLSFMFQAKGKPASFREDETKADTYTEGALGVMTSYNRIGAVASSANKAVVYDIMRTEWGFKGYNVTDFTGVSLRAAPKESILAGTTAFCGFGSASLDYWNSDTLSKDKDMCAAIKENCKFILYSLANSNALNGVNSSTKVVQLMTWWRATYIALIAVFSVATAALLALHIVFDIVKEKKETANEQN